MDAAREAGTVFFIELLFNLVSLLRGEKSKNSEYQLRGWKRQAGQPQCMQDIKGRK